MPFKNGIKPGKKCAVHILCQFNFIITEKIFEQLPMGNVALKPRCIGASELCFFLGKIDYKLDMSFVLFQPRTSFWVQLVLWHRSVIVLCLSDMDKKKRNAGSNGTIGPGKEPIRPRKDIIGPRKEASGNGTIGAREDPSKHEKKTSKQKLAAEKSNIDKVLQHKLLPQCQWRWFVFLLI